jgi:hypothetical protein
LDVAFQGVEMITYLMDHNDIVQMGKHLGIHIRKHKMPAAFDIVYVMWHVWLLSKNTTFINALSSIQAK